MNNKLYNICASTGKYTDHNGNNKNRYINVGSLFKGKYGIFIVLNAYFNPAGIPRKDGSDSIILSLFRPKDNSSNNSQAQDYSNSDSFQQDVPEPIQWNPDEPPADISF